MYFISIPHISFLCFSILFHRLKVHALTENEIKLNMMLPRYIIIAISLIYGEYLL